MTFSDLGLSSALLKAVEEKGYTKPSPIQEKVIPHILEGKDILASAQTGTGKTAGFTLPILQYLSEIKQEKHRPLRALILTPTRELAAQVYENVREYGKYVDVKSTVVFGGVNIRPQMSTLRRGVDLLVATPGRVLDLYNQHAVSFKHIDVFVLDEADRMLDMGFVRDIKKIMVQMPPQRQNLLFSATFSNEIKKLASGILNNPIRVETAAQNATAQKVTHKVYNVDKGKKTTLMIKLIKDNQWNQVLVFTRTKHGANKLTEKLVKSGISAAAIHGNKTQGARIKALKSFKENTVKVLVATDIASRGLDIPLLPHVINYELPNVPEDYVHRIGRTGRAGAEGEAISLVCSEEIGFKNEIEKILKEKLETSVLEGFEPVDTAPPKRAASQNKKPYGKNRRSTNSNAYEGNKSNRNSHFRGNQSGSSSGGRRTGGGSSKKKRY